MITLISATHRPKNQTSQVVKKYREILHELGEETTVFELSELPDEFLIGNSFHKGDRGLSAIVDEKILPARKFVIISPEYNGSYPGLFKAFLDMIPPSVWRGKKIALVGVASGRAGNLRGMDHLTDVFHHMRAEIFSLKVPVSRLDDLMKDGDLHDENHSGFRETGQRIFRLLNWRIDAEYRRVSKYKVFRFLMECAKPGSFCLILYLGGTIGS